MLDLITCLVITIAIGTGMWTLENHHAYFSEFVVTDVFKFKLDASLYLFTSFSTAACVVELILRVAWLFQVGWDHAEYWQIRWLGWHMMNASVFCFFHIAIDRYLSSIEARRNGQG